MELNTCDKNGKNNFGYFNRDDKGRYGCSSNNVNKLTISQANFLNELHNEYHDVRHQYSHWSADDYDTAIITDIEDAREYLLKGLTLINKYYTLY